MMARLVSLLKTSSSCCQHWCHFFLSVHLLGHKLQRKARCLSFQIMFVFRAYCQHRAPVAQSYIVLLGHWKKSIAHWSSVCTTAASLRTFGCIVKRPTSIRQPESWRHL